MNHSTAMYLRASDTAARHAAETTSQLAAARRLRLGGTAGQLPRNYFADAPAPAVRPPSSAICHPSSVVRP